MIDTMERRYSYLLIMLSCCLSWQEQSAEAVLAVGDSATMKSAKKHYDTAIAKILFLEHALVHCLTTDRAQSVLRRLRGLLLSRWPPRFTRQSQSSGSGDNG